MKGVRKKHMIFLAFLIGVAGLFVVVALKAENRQPVLTPIESRIAAQGYPLEIQAIASDPDEDPIRFTIDNLPPGAHFDNQTGKLRWVPQNVGRFTDIKITVYDRNLSDSSSFTIEIKAMPESITPPADGVLIMNMVYYGQHTPALDQSIIEAKPEYLIANTPHGLWSEMSGYNFFPGIAQYQKAGVKIIGYITAGYEGTHSGGNIGSEWFSLETNLELIKNMAERDQIDGVFIDECSSFPDLQSKAYLKALTSLATSLGLVTWGNVGVADFDSWFFTDGGFDLMHSNEDWHGQPLTAFQKEWAYRISVTGIFNDITAKRALELTTDARAKGLAYCYISVGYHSIPKWFEEYVALLRD